MLLTYIVILGIFYVIGICTGIAIEEWRNDNVRYPFAKATHEQMQSIYKKVAANAKANAIVWK